MSGAAGRFGLEAGSLKTEDVRSTAWPATGATIELAGDLEVDVTSGVDECF
ncbi:DUF6230 family protein [Actinoplanes flavus]|uniref:Uncharacterized protein n=1 Tax=Actinoplanes flavus TaxID=2820290 RepID=A0ABS3UKL4_9ACTN|nr:DUF6230 family protein [Actinoplanes flavus]MBO3739281.1 hypothetical protein [Actinoplanes flavus]